MILARFQMICMFFVISNCYTLDLNLQNSEQHVYFSDTDDIKISSFEINHTNYYWFGYNLSGNLDIKEALAAEMRKYPGAKGMKKLRIRVYNKSWYSFNALPNPAALITAQFWVYFGYPLGFANKSYYITGEIY